MQRDESMNPSTNPIRVFGKIASLPVRGAELIKDGIYSVVDGMTALPDIVESIAETPTSLNRAFNETAKNIAGSVDNTVESVVSIPGTVKKTVKSLNPFNVVDKALVKTREALDSFYSYQDKMDLKDIEKEKRRIAATKKRLEARQRAEEAEQGFERTKESIYGAFDTIENTIEGVITLGKNTVELGKVLVGAVEEVQKVPEKISSTKQSIETSIEELKEDFEVKQQQFEELKDLTWRIVTLEEAKKAYAKTEAWVKETSESVDALSTKIKDPSLFFEKPKPKLNSKASPFQGMSSGTVAISKGTASSPASAPSPATSGQTVTEAFKATQDTVKMASETIASVQSGVSELQKRIDERLALMAESEKAAKSNIIQVEVAKNKPRVISDEPLFKMPAPITAVQKKIDERLALIAESEKFAEKNIVVLQDGWFTPSPELAPALTAGPVVDISKSMPVSASADAPPVQLNKSKAIPTKFYGFQKAIPKDQSPSQ